MEVPELVRASLFRHLHEVPQVGIVRRAFHDQVRMIRHEAVGENCKLFFAGSAVKLPNRATDKVRFDE
jgi:hypothetical protein